MDLAIPFYQMCIDWKKAFDYYLKSAEQGDLDALFAVGECYRHGHGTETDKGKAMLYLKKAAEKGHKSALNVLTVSIKDF